MAVGYKNLDPFVAAQLSPGVAQTYYMVDSDFRTAAQGWSRADGTGPLDLYEARKAGRGGTQYVYRTGDYTTDAVALQAAIDDQVDFRGDALFFTPGNYSIATARTIDVPDARWLGPAVSHPTLSRAILTAAVANAFAVGAAADRMEIGYLQMVPLTAETMWDVAAVSGMHFHDNFWNADGIAASLLTIFVAPATSTEFLSFDNSYIWIDAGQGPWINCEGIMKGLSVRNFTIFLESGTWAAAIDLEGVGAANFDIGPGVITGGGTALTSLVTMADKTLNTTHGFVHNIRASTVGPAATALAVPTGVAAEIDIVDCWRAVAVDTVPPAHNAVTTDTQCGTPYTG